LISEKKAPKSDRWYWCPCHNYSRLPQPTICLQADWVSSYNNNNSNSFYYRLVVHITDAIIQYKSTKMVSQTVALYRIGICTRPTLRGATHFTTPQL